MNKTGNRKPKTENWLLAHPYQIIFYTCLLLYAQILSFGLVHFDDHGFVLMAADTLKLSNILKFFNHSVFWVLGDSSQQFDIYYRPLQNVVYAVCNTLATKQAWIYHFAGLSFHILSCICLFNFFRELKFHNSISLLFALIYSVHPVLVQGVAWIAGIGDQMAAVFCLLSATYFMKLVSENKFNGKYFSLCLLAFSSAVFSKEVSVMLILVCLFYFFFLNRNKNYKNLFLVSVEWFFILTLYFSLRKNALPVTQTSLISSTIGSVKANGLLLLEYFEKIFLPYRLSPIPSREDAQYLIGGIIFFGFISFLFFRKRFTRLVCFGVLWFFIFLLPTFIQQNPQEHFFAFEHRLYLPLIGIVIMLIELLNLKEINFHSQIQKYGFAFVLILFFGITFSHSRTFKDPYRFYDKAISSSPKSVIAYNGYGKLLLEDKKYSEAIEAFKKSYEYKSDDIQTTGKIAEIYMKNLNNPQEAIVWFKKTLQIDSTSVEATVSIGDTYWNFIRDTANAITWYKNALKIQPKNEFALANLGVIYASKGKNGEAKNYLSQSLSANPKNLLSLKWMAISLFNEGKISDAISFLNRAYENYPNDADVLRNLMICYYKQKDFENTKKFSVFYLQSGNKIPDEIQKYVEKQIN